MSFYQSRNFTKTLCSPNILSELHIYSFFLFEFTTILINHPAVFLFLAVNIILSKLNHFFKTVFQKLKINHHRKKSIVKQSQVIVLLLDLYCRSPLNIIRNNMNNINEHFWKYGRSLIAPPHSVLYTPKHIFFNRHSKDLIIREFKII